MDPAIDERRALLVRIRNVVECYERHARNGVRLMQGVRYDLAVRATDVNGDACLFPACGCARADCSQQPPDRPSMPWPSVPFNE